MRISRDVLAEMINHAREEFPLECCGLLSGRADRVARLTRIKNIRASRTSFAMGPEELCSFMRDVRERGQEFVGIYHSHPSSPARPSSRDLEELYYRELSYWIVSLEDPERPCVKCFVCRDGHFQELAFSICSPLL